MRWYHYLLLVLVIAPVTALAYLLGQRGTSFDEERRALEARAKAKKLAAEIGALRAAAQIERDYASTIAKLAQEAKDEIERLRSDPVALADLLTRLSD